MGCLIVAELSGSPWRSLETSDPANTLVDGHKHFQVAGLTSLGYHLRHAIGNYTAKPCVISSLKIVSHKPVTPVEILGGIECRSGGLVA